MYIKSMYLNCTGAQPNEYRVFIQYYSKLTSILQVDLCPHFVTSNIITISDQDEIIKTATTSHKAADYLT